MLLDIGLESLNIEININILEGPFVMETTAVNSIVTLSQIIDKYGLNIINHKHYLYFFCFLYILNGQELLISYKTNYSSK